MKIIVSVEVDAAQVGAMVDALSATGLAERITVGAMSVPASVARVPAVVEQLGAMATRVPSTSTRPRAERKVGSGVASKVLVPIARMDVARMKAMVAKGERTITPIEEKVAAVIFAHAKKGGIPEAGVVTATGLNYHSVSGAVFSLRGAKGSKPAIIASVPVVQAKANARK